jgi:cytosine deaminase
MRDCLRLITELPAQILGLEKYGLAVGNHADLVVLQAADTFEAIRLRPARLAVVRRGNVVAETPRVTSRMKLPGRAETLDTFAIRASS